VEAGHRHLGGVETHLRGAIAKVDAGAQGPAVADNGGAGVAPDPLIRAQVDDRPRPERATAGDHAGGEQDAGAHRLAQHQWKDRPERRHVL
jgi:hypothetical protein